MSMDAHRGKEHSTARTSLSAGLTQRSEPADISKLSQRDDFQMSYSEQDRPHWWLHGFERSTFTSVMNVGSRFTSPTPHHICTHARK